MSTPRTVRGGAIASLLPLVLAAILAALAVVAATLGLRSDLPAALAGPEGIKVAACASAAAGAIPACLATRSRREGTGLAWFALAPSLALFAAPAWGALSMAQDVVATATPRLGAGSFGAVLATSLVTFGVLLPWMRERPVARPGMAGAALGLLAAGIAATAVALHCTGDTPMVISLWYPAAMAIAALAGAVAGRRWLVRRDRFS